MLTPEDIRDACKLIPGFGNGSRNHWMYKLCKVVKSDYGYMEVQSDVLFLVYEATPEDAHKLRERLDLVFRKPDGTSVGMCGLGSRKHPHANLRSALRQLSPVKSPC